MAFQELVLWIIPALILVVVGHGMWVKMRTKEGFLRMDIKPRKSEEHLSEQDLVGPELKGELPNGGARIVEATAETLSFNINTGRPKKIPGRKEPWLESGDKPQSGNPEQLLRTSSEVTDIRADTLESSVVVLHVISDSDSPISGEALVRALQKQNLKYGDMGIFHCLETETNKKIYSVANALEPGSFDLSDMASFSTVGITFFFTPTEHSEPIPAFDKMLEDINIIAKELGCVLKDQNMSPFGGQGVEHLRQQVIDFARRSLARR
jgi:FtsZ-interacting cell division protein ZipA